MNINLKISKLELQLQKLYKQKESQKSRKTFKCVCGKFHKIRECSLIQHHYYNTRAYEEGWEESSISIECPVSKLRNQVHFNYNDDIGYPTMYDYEYDANKQFKRKYYGLFKDVIKEYENSWQSLNNDYFEKNRKKFGVCK